ncbi:MAG TPA: phosphatase PAP2 family protein [Gemmatimonadales bacterium]|nr:phosphatase PAP2 family protein [Gemmatimonadales bacterium]
MRLHPPFTRFPTARLCLALTLAAVAQPAFLRAQAEPLPGPSATVRWWQPVLMLGGAALLMVVDEPVSDFVQDNRTATLDDLAGVRALAEPTVYLSLVGGTVAAGLISGDTRVTRAGGRLALTLAIAGGLTQVGKLASGRDRPLSGTGATSFHPFSGAQAFPSGHTSVAFGIATSLSDEIRRPWATAVLYSGAGLVAWSRVNDNKHWLSDVAAGAMLGVFSAKVANGHWRVFGIRPPGVAAGPRGLSVAWQVEF